MNRYSYVAKDHEGKIIKGDVEAENKAKIITMLQEMGYVPVTIRQGEARSRGKVLHYVGKDSEGNVVDGSIEIEDAGDLNRKLQELSLAEVRIGTRKNLDISQDDTAADKFAKVIGGIMVILILFAAGVITTGLPRYIDTKFLSPDASQVIDGQITRVEPEAGLVAYAYEIGGKQYSSTARVPKDQMNSYKAATPVALRVSKDHPSFSRIDALSPSTNAGFPIGRVGIAMVFAMLILFYASAFHYISRIRKAQAAGKKAPPNDVKRLLTNAVGVLLVPMFAAIMVITNVARDETSFYHPYFVHNLVALGICVAAAFWMKFKGPVYYD